MRRQAIMFLAVFATTVWGLGAPAGWNTNYRAAMTEAQRRGLPVVVDFGSATCPACRMLERRTLSDARVQAALDDFVKVYVDGNEQVSLRESFGVQYYPTLVYLSPEGKVLKRQVGFVGPEEMHAIATQVAATARRPAPTMVVAQAAGGSEPRAGGATVGKNTRRVGNFYENVAAAGAKQEAKTRPQIVAAVETERRARAQWVAETADAGAGAKRAIGGADQLTEERQVAQALPMPKNIETPAPLVNVAPSSEAGASPAPSPTATKAAATPAPTGKAGVPASIKKLQEPSEEAAPRPAAPVTSPKAAATETPVPKKTPAQERKAPTEEKGSAPKSSGKKGPAAASGPSAQEVPAPKRGGATPALSATAEDVEKWFADAESKLMAGYKKEARAMYAKIVERDPENKFGRSDLAFIKMVALTVDREDDNLRRTAHAKIKEFLKRYPNSPHKDYYTVVRAILAADLGDYAEAHALLDRFPEEFPGSRYEELARSVWQELPKDAKSLQRKPQATPTRAVSAASGGGTGKAASASSRASSGSSAKSSGSNSSARKPASSAAKAPAKSSGSSSKSSLASKTATGQSSKGSATTTAKKKSAAATPKPSD